MYRVNSTNKNIKYYLFYIWTLVLLLGLGYFLLSLVIEMPHNKWLTENLPIWTAVFNYILFGICFVIMAIPRRSVILNQIVLTIIILSSFIAKASMNKAPLINQLILVVSIILFISIRYYFHKKEKIDIK